ncbi:ABC transporter substrate-binding protein [Marinimicrobium sp. ABcell2]|uniref:substrate-binding periplasmic protein n=1 Tax=Marinimicrobium sp. ABcell2 TaxID=3069751 RepID=UPI0027B11E91|nr:transporter substrate-binding domain-containing protein [Marinimicrobium sp. ABcell2]MDQ2077741.1 transporter substrate-binding domain-containing protein [Marinimicrobium sp. ABcell2]
MAKLIAALLLTTLLMATVSTPGLAAQEAEPQVIVVPNYGLINPGSNNDFFVRVLTLALDKTVPSHGPYQLVPAVPNLVDHRLRAAVNKGLVDVCWFNAHREAESELLAIRHPLLGEINQYRALLIRGDDQHRFSAVKSLDDLRQLRGGTSAQWPDTLVLDANKLPYVTSPQYDSLFRMLAAGRFDYFSRGLYQIKREVERFPELNLVIEETLLLHYPNNMYFFVGKDNTELAERIEEGLELAREDGSYAEVYNSIPQYRWAQEQLDNQSRRVLKLDTATLQEDKDIPASYLLE